MDSEAKQKFIEMDAPLEDDDDDLLGMDSYVDFLVDDYFSNFTAFKQKGFRFGITGQWGSGKTSLINLLKNKMEKSEEYKNKVLFMSLNPWHFSNGENSTILPVFFQEMSRNFASFETLSQRKQIARSFDKYGASFLSIAGPAGKSLYALIQTFRSVRKVSTPPLANKFKKLEKLFRTLDKTIYIVIDDVDRLYPTEIRELFKFVRQIGDLPNLVYIIAYDRDMVSDSLTEGKIYGSDYIKKIIQLEIPTKDLNNSDLTRLLVDNERDAPKAEEYFVKKAFPLVTNIRDVKKIKAGFEQQRGIFSELIDLNELLVLEIVKHSHPEFFNLMKKRIDILTSAPQFDANGSVIISENDYGRFEPIREYENITQGTKKEILEYLFPGSEKFLAESYQKSKPFANNNSQISNNLDGKIRVAAVAEKYFSYNLITNSVDVSFKMKEYFFYDEKRSGFNEHLKDSSLSALKEIFLAYNNYAPFSKASELSFDEKNRRIISIIKRVEAIMEIEESKLEIDRFTCPMAGLIRNLLQQQDEIVLKDSIINLMNESKTLSMKGIIVFAGIKESGLVRNSWNAGKVTPPLFDVERDKDARMRIANILIEEYKKSMKNPNVDISKEWNLLWVFKNFIRPLTDSGEILEFTKYFYKQLFLDLGESDRKKYENSLKGKISFVDVESLRQAPLP